MPRSHFGFVGLGGVGEACGGWAGWAREGGGCLDHADKNVLNVISLVFVLVPSVKGLKIFSLPNLQVSWFSGWAENA